MGTDTGTTSAAARKAELRVRQPGSCLARVNAGAGTAGRVQLFHIRPGRPWLPSVLWEPGAESPVLNLRNRCRTTGTSLDHKWPLK